MPAIYTGQTFRVTVSGLADAAGVALVAPVVTITATAPDGTIANGTVIPSGLTHYAEFVPTQAGLWKTIAQAVAGTGTWVSESFVAVSPR